MITKKELKENSHNSTYTGWNGHRIRINAFYFDWKSGDYKENGIVKNFVGYRFMLAANNKHLSKAELFNMFHKWVNNLVVEIPYYVRHRFAATDKERFKVSIAL